MFPSIFKPLKRAFSFIARIGAEPGDSADTLIKKRLVSVNSFVYSIIFICIVAPFYFHFYETGGALIYLGFALLTLLGLGLMVRWPKLFPVFVFLTLFLGLLGSFVGTVLLGGFMNSSGLPFWGSVAVLRAMVHYGPKKSLYWFGVYLVILGLCLAAHPFVREVNNVPHAYVTGLFVFDLIIITSISFGGLYVFMKQRDHALELFHIEQQKAENLLLNILPPEIAAILRNDQSTIADHYEECSILFADVVNFTPLSVRLSPVQLVGLLNEVFSHFDALVEKHGLEKIKTIGDSYMVAAGVPRSRVDHAQALTRLALEINNYVREREFGAGKLVFRIGINSGPVVAGVIGRKKFIYDLWGDAVNTASRMESQGIDGSIQITEATYELIRNDFICREGGVVNVKGKGEMKVWHVLGEKSPHPDPLPS